MGDSEVSRSNHHQSPFNNSESEQDDDGANEVNGKDDWAVDSSTKPRKRKKEDSLAHIAQVPTRSSDPCQKKAKLARDDSKDKSERDVDQNGELSDYGLVSKFVDLAPLPSEHETLPPLTNAERKGLERALEITANGKHNGTTSQQAPNTWREDWIGNLAFADEDIVDPDGKSNERQKKSLFRWAERGKVSLKLLHNLIRLVYNIKGTPRQARKILGNADPTSVRSIQEAVRRVYYDPKVLKQDGWTTNKSSDPVGASGGPHRIGERVSWQGYDGVIIAYIHDHDLGDLWKAIWLEEFDTFDLEAEELDSARKRYIRKKKQKQAQLAKSTNPSSSSQSSAVSNRESKPGDTARRSGRYASAEFHVNGIEHGIVLAVSYSRGSRPGVFWPARVMHFTEMQSYGSSNKRGSQKQKVDVVFLAPYWNSPPNQSNSRRAESYSESLSRHGSSIFNSGPLFEVENIDASEDSIQEYPYNAATGLDIDQLRTSFKFAGLPRAAFSRFVDSHRLALGLRTFSESVMESTVATDLDRTTAGLFEAHPIAGQTACFPPALLHLPFEFILSQLPPSCDMKAKTTVYDDDSNEPALQLGVVLESMKPPTCWGLKDGVTLQSQASPEVTTQLKHFASSPLPLQFEASDKAAVTVDRFLHGLTSLSSLLSHCDSGSSMSNLLAQNLGELLDKIPSQSPALEKLSISDKRDRLKKLTKLWIVVKTHGEELISSYSQSTPNKQLVEWRRACERIFKFFTIAFSSDGFGNGTSCVVTDSVCNLHLTSSECFERAVRLPAALKAARQAGAGNDKRIQLLQSVEEKYLSMAENQVIRRAHSKAYLQKIKKRCNSVSHDREVVSLTEDSDGNGGEDTKGSKGSWKAAIAGVGAAVQAVDMVMNGECVNVFCVTRPPGHHAGRSLHAMKAVSNGFCLLNAAACAALYATSPISEGGPSLRRVCVIDIDVHHGNGTQDILCSTYDPRFLYVSMHAGGPDVNGIDAAGDGEQLPHHLGRNPKKGIFPGRCGDTSPHPGVLNMPLGSRVTSHAIGAALVTKVTPAVESFSPELIIISTGFDAHKNDPLGLGGLSAEDFGTLTEVICKLAHKTCSGRVLSILEGGYGVPCCRLQNNLFDPERLTKTSEEGGAGSTPDGRSSPLSESKDEKGAGKGASVSSGPRQDSTQKPLEILDLGEDLPPDMMDIMPYSLQRRLEKCHAEGFINCVREHVTTLAKCNKRT